LPTCLRQKKPDLVPKQPDSTHKAYTYKTCMTKQKIDIKTGQKNQCNTNPVLRTGPPREITTGRETLSKTCPL